MNSSIEDDLANSIRNKREILFNYKYYEKRSTFFCILSWFLTEENVSKIEKSFRNKLRGV